MNSALLVPRDNDFLGCRFDLLEGGAVCYVLQTPRGCVMTTNGHRLYLRLGDKVSHQRYGQWGEGTVVEEMTSTVPGGTCLVRIMFGDGRERVFHNDMDSELCCYYFGIRKFWNMDPETFEPRRVRRTTRTRRIGSRKG